MNVIERDLREMKVQPKPNVKCIMKRPYRLNTKYKEKVRYKLNKMLSIGIIIPIEELEWIKSMVVQDKKIGGNIICVVLCNLNYAWVHDPSPIPFTNYIIENIGGNEVYSFIDGFFRLSPRKNHRGR